MSSTKLEHLNFNCLIEILKQIKSNCVVNQKSTLDKFKYADLINFGLTCDWFREVLLEWDPGLYNRLEIEQTYLSAGKRVSLNFDKLYKRLQKLTLKDKEMFWKMYIDALKSNTQLEEIELKYNAEIYQADFGEIVKKLMSAIKNKCCLKKLNIDIKGFLIDRLPQLRNLKTLTVNAKINVSDLVECCKSNPKLSRLEIMNNEIYGELADIVPHCENLKDLSFVIKTNFNDAEYTQLAELPNLVNLQIVGRPEDGSINPLIRSLVARETSNLKKLIINSAPLDETEILEVCRMQSLEEFKCSFNHVKHFKLRMFRSEKTEFLSLTFEQETDATDLAFLSNITNLKSLRIMGQHRVGTLKLLLENFAEMESPNLRDLMCEECGKNKIVTKFNNIEMLEVFKIKSLKSLHCGFSDTQPIEYPNQLNQIDEVTIESHKSGSLQNLFKAFAQQLSTGLNLNIDGCPLSREEIIEVSKIKLVNGLSCGFIDIKDMQHLVELKELEAIAIISQHLLYDFSKAVLRFFEATNGSVGIYSPKNCISFDKNVRALTITMTQNIDSRNLVPLASLPNLPNLSIYGRHEINSLEAIFKAFANGASTALQELTIQENSVSKSEIQQIAQIKTLIYLECGFSEPGSLELLKDLPVLETLRIRSLHNFYDTEEGFRRVLMGCSNEMTVIRDYREITFNKNLGKLTILNSSYEDEVHNAQEFTYLAQLPQLRSLHICGRHQLGSFKDLFESIAVNKSSTLEEIIFKLKDTDPESVKGLIINYAETVEVSKISTLKRIKCGFSNGKCVGLLTKLPNLKELILSRYPEYSLRLFLQKLATKNLCKLQSLKLMGQSLSFEDIAELSKVNSLKRLDFTFADGQNMELLAKLTQLEELTIGADECVSLETLLQALVSTESKTLQLLKITQRPISYEELLIIVEIKNLKKLCCILTDSQCFKLLVQLTELTELSLILKDCEIKGIEILAELNNLTDLEIQAPETGSLLELFKQLSSRKVQSLKSLVIEGKDIDSGEMEIISQLKSLKRLQCGFEEEKFYECLTDLTDLEVLDITSYIYFNDIAQTMLKLLQKCHKLTEISIHYGSRFVELQFLENALKILKTVRNPVAQEALQLHIPYFGGLTPEQIAISDERYLIIRRFIKELD